jgi:hypothetical protein
LGNGWIHGYDIRITPTSHGEPGMGMRQPVRKTGTENRDRIIFGTTSKPSHPAKQGKIGTELFLVPH